MRRRREEEGIQLRKQKREQQLIKRRNVNVAEELDQDAILTVGLLLLTQEMFTHAFVSISLRSGRNPITRPACINQTGNTRSTVQC